ncbi:hypothetical protein FK220_008610 [Flavobacteriaceae bacterium TP-CH-4]|uniref:Uncharacterized protein n=1 Tax=Pelagihabitans pacificus TaxID=2696054 RepID=A0A967AUR5_9FLAO|nr:DUF6263 family protein [Pelagihabitans pacificus]NHF59398.1 hypothetical protein [Pelagihabitans pacificus]
MKYIIHFVCLVVMGSVSPAQTNLEYHLEKDDVFTIKQDAQQIITQNMDGAVHEITNNVNGILEFRVMGEKEGNYEIALRFKDLNMRMTSSIQGELMNVNAKEADEGDMQSMMFNSLLEIPVTMVLAKNGDILKVIGGDSLVGKMAEASGLEDEFSINMMKKSLEKEFGSEALSNSYEQMTYIYPTEDVQVGDTWENEYSGKLNAKNQWTLDAISDTNAEISGSADVIMEVTEPTTTMKLNGAQQTSVITELASGFIKSMTVEGLAEGWTTMVQLGDQEIPTSIKSKVTYQLINK